MFRVTYDSNPPRKGTERVPFTQTLSVGLSIWFSLRSKATMCDRLHGTSPSSPFLSFTPEALTEHLWCVHHYAQVLGIQLGKDK